MIAGIAALLLAVSVPGPIRNSLPGTQARSFEQISRAAQQARDENRDEDAIRLFRQGLKLKSDWEEGLWYLGTMLYEKERFDEARDLFRRFVGQNPKFGPGWALLGMSEFQTREYARSLEHLRRGMTLGVGDRKHLADSVFYHTALLLARFEQYHDSLELLWQMRGAGQAESLLEEPAGIAALGYALLPGEIPDSRREMFRLAGAGTFALLDQRREDAEKLFDKMVRQFPQEPGVHYQYGSLLLNNRPEDGVKELQKELEVSPSHIPSRLRLAEYYLAQSDSEMARPFLDEVVRLEPKNASAHMFLGELLAAKGDNSGAIRELELAREQAPTRTKIRWDLLRAYQAAGRREDASREKMEIEKLTAQQSGKP